MKMLLVESLEVYLTRFGLPNQAKTAAAASLVA